MTAFYIVVGIVILIFFWLLYNCIANESDISREEEKNDGEK